jgi:outer membrane murein-binding lipoprotein Lpp
MGCDNVTITRVPDGVIVQDTGVIQQLESELDLFIRIERNPMEGKLQGLIPILSRANKLIRESGRYDLPLSSGCTGDSCTHRWFGNQNVSKITKILGARLVQINGDLGDVLTNPPKLHHEVRTKRRRRGAIDFIGDIGSSLFGLATEKELDQVASAVEELGERQETIVEHQNQLIGAVDALAREANRSRAAVAELQRMSEGFRSMFEFLVEDTAEITRLLEVDTLLSLAERIHTDLNQIENRAHMKVILCQSGTVTEDLLPRSFLNSMSAITKYGRALSAEWYYGHLVVDKYFETPDAVFCKIRIPLVHDEPYLSRNIFTYPVKRGDGLVTKIMHDAYVAIGSVSGRLSIGTDPTVCHAGMVFNPGQELCVRGILSNNSNQKKLCRVQASCIEQAHRLVKTGKNAYVVYTKDGELIKRCPEQSPVSVDLDEGLYIVTLNEGCVAETPSWRVEGVRYVTRKISDNPMKGLTFPTFPHINSTWSTKIKVHLNLTNRQETHVDDDFVIKLPPTMPPKKIEVWHPTHTNFSLYAAIALGGILIVAVAFYFFLLWLSPVHETG